MSQCLFPLCRRCHKASTITASGNTYCPLFEPTLIALDTPPIDCFIKRHCLTSYDRVLTNISPSRVFRDLLADVGICKILKRHPHPNIARYLGCQVRNSRIIRFYFARYSQILMGRVKAGSHMEMFFKGCGWAANDCNRCMTGVEKGFRHPYSLGLVHNDGFCRPIGQSLEGLGANL